MVSIISTEKNCLFQVLWANKIYFLSKACLDYFFFYSRKQKRCKRLLSLCQKDSEVRELRRFPIAKKWDNWSIKCITSTIDWIYYKCWNSWDHIDMKTTTQTHKQLTTKVSVFIFGCWQEAHYFEKNNKENN